MNERTKPLIEHAVRMVELKTVCRQLDLQLFLLSEFPAAKKNDILEAISEASQDGKIMRVEFTLPDRYDHEYLYIPIGSKLI